MVKLEATDSEEYSQLATSPEQMAQRKTLDLKRWYVGQTYCGAAVPSHLRP